MFNLTSFNKQPDIPYKDNSTAVSNTISGAPTTFGLTSTIATAISTAAASYETAMDNLYTAETAYRAAVADKETARLALETKWATYVPMMYANPTVTNGVLGSIGFAPKSARGPFVEPIQVTAFTVNAINNGYAKFKWDRNGNNAATVFVLEQKSGTGDWLRVWSGTRSKVQLTGYTPGVEVFFRVFATKGEFVSEPSDTQVIYPSSGIGELSIAA
ncbi:MAG: fibronectin type III domain-containing protein [Armatimonadetes bacterium]|nr:fibronectin type III domain-containing protein [Armatimonadota bacterium]